MALFYFEEAGGQCDSRVDDNNNISGCISMENGQDTYVECRDCCLVDKCPARKEE